MDNRPGLEELIALFVQRGGVITIWPCTKGDRHMNFAMKFDGVESRGDTNNLGAVLREELSLDDQDIGGDYDWAKPDSMF